MRTQEEVDAALYVIQEAIQKALRGKVHIRQFGETSDYVIVRYGEICQKQVFFRKYLSYIEIESVQDPLWIASSFIRDCQSWESEFKKKMGE